MMSYSERVEMIGRERIVPERFSVKAPIRHLDLTLILTILVLSAIGSVAVYSSTQGELTLRGLDPASSLKRQLVYIAVASAVFIGMLLFDYRQFRGLSPAFYGGALLLLLLVLTPIGRTVSGAQRWISLGFFQIQPSELAKVAVLVILAALFSEERQQDGSVNSRLPLALLLVGVPAALIFVQPDLGTLLVLPAILFGILLIAGVKARWLIMLVLTGIVSFILILNLGLIRDYQLARLLAFMDPKNDPQRAGYNLEQSMIAIGSGGVTGKGLLNGSQTNLAYVPEQHTDFIFTVIAEEKGFLGSIVVLALFLILLWRILRIAMVSKDMFGTLLAAGVAAMVAFQVFVNIGMTIGIMPITGIPLPFISYGGSSLVASYGALGLVTNVHMRRFV
jgi:rod shape determining protein RodA